MSIEPKKPAWLRERILPGFFRSPILQVRRERPREVESHDGLVTRTVAGDQSLLPIWHDLTADDVRAYSTSLADKVAQSTEQYSIEEIAEQIAEVVNEAGHSDRSQ